ncbi:hypothetical protein BU14_0052s0088 [Porphyra umbilicalis]|uniref:Uncharacterized protein n=1 Tax=Porphyra umbilicalis TaxID=2786 RepID=A0A1X6PI25_PORUM|nr:hypothetical protein BU14_0052s0088 [Porphyra umbilicalis]|eukprot:OSX80475.1 hypothetical protein BU14_0052s0088 [Porphyra umbilicalis]
MKQLVKDAATEPASARPPRPRWRRRHLVVGRRFGARRRPGPHRARGADALRLGLLGRHGCLSQLVHLGLHLATLCVEEADLVFLRTNRVVQLLPLVVVDGVRQLQLQLLQMHAGGHRRTTSCFGGMRSTVGAVETLAMVQGCQVCLNCGKRRRIGAKQRAGLGAVVGVQIGQQGQAVARSVARVTRCL